MYAYEKRSQTGSQINPSWSAWLKILRFKLGQKNGTLIKTMPMGLRSSAMCCQRVTNANISQQFRFSLGTISWWFGHSRNSREGSQSISNNGWDPRVGRTERIYSETPQPKHTNGFPENTIRYHEFNSVRHNCSRSIRSFRSVVRWKHMSRKAIQSVVGKFQFLANCVRPGRLFVSRILEFMRGSPRQGALSSHRQCQSWHAVLQTVLTQKQWDITDGFWPLPDEVLVCDACLAGCVWLAVKVISRTYPALCVKPQYVSSI